MTKAEKRIFKEYITKQKKQREEEIDCRRIEKTLKSLTAAVTEICTEISEQFSDILKNAEAEEESKER